ncbi:DNA/RNA polymerase [Trichocladium antarcticum]|uniref:DNA-directed RNA polymerase n=1 Tax=Trichocladium antarcticum TaxID=1450529 RepID=A0AAN6UCZ6_9PEZI|nr:DNA/RNA polymerase [Trichocladium antarcticum]
MLVRPGAARQHLPVRRLLSACPLRSPSRCSIANSDRPLAGPRRVLTTTTDSRPWKRKTFRALVGFERNLATALEEHRFGDDIPFEGLPGGLAGNYLSRPPGTSQSPLYELKTFDVSSPLVIGEQPSYPVRQRINLYGIPGDLDEMLSIFEACVHVGRMDRAALVLKRLGSMDILSPEQLMDLHDRFLEGRLAQLMAEPSAAKAEKMHEWFELNVQDARLPLTPITIAYMLKATLLTSEGTTLQKRVDRYMGMIPQHDAAESLDLGNALTDEDLAAIAEICPAYYVPEDVPTSTEAGAASDEAAELADLEEHDGQEYTSNTSASTPNVLSTPQKGMGLKSLKATLSLFSEIPGGADIASLPMETRREIQERLERDCVDAAISRWRDEKQTLSGMGLNSQLSAPSLNSKMFDWHQSLEARLAEEQAMVEMSEAVTKKAPEDLDRCIYGPLLLQSPPSRLAAVTILCSLSLLAMTGADRGVPVANLVQQVARVAEEDIRLQAATRRMPNTKNSTKRKMNARKLIRLRSGAPRDPPVATAATTATAGEPASDNADLSLEARWPLAIKAKLGAVLLSSLIDTAKISVEREHPVTKEKLLQLQPAFSHSVQLKRGRKIGIIQPNRDLVELMKREPRGEALARHLPMVVEPEPWTKFETGGFIQCPNPLVRLKHHERDQKIYAQAAIERGDMEQMMRGLDVLGKTAWRINPQVFDVMLGAWNTGEEFANLPALDPQFPMPIEPDSTDDPMQRRLWLKAIKAIENEKSGLHSVRCFMNFQLEIARAFRDQTFYFPHNLDFRGRAYPLPTYLNHMGADHMRGLLLFANGKPLGEGGLRWLKVHLSNVFGFDKASLTEREQFATDNLHNIYDSAENPLTGKRWWLKAEDPWQCLATCFELKAALQSPDPAAFVSHLPVHQDGTCNGLQHYAALGGDTWGAQQVNLIPGERPADVYSAVAELVQEHITKDKAEGNEFANAVDGKITRKVVKQTVMTNVYGVTFIGAKKQVQKQLDSLYPDLEKETGLGSTICASYIATKIFIALSTMFRGAHDIQNWLGEIGGRVCRAITPDQLRQLADPTFEEPASVRAKKTKTTRGKEEELAGQFRNTLVWTTPLRMPVVQPYRKSGTRVIRTCLQDLALTATDRDDPVNRRKQLQAFPPNFIHSLDASHMMLSALECSEIGLTFAAVHDSFWTHAADVDKMNRVIRDSFIRIHSEDVIGRLRAEFEARYRGSIYRAKIDNSTPVAKKIAAHRKTTRLGPKEELLTEARRQMLLCSSDPKEVKKGQEMVTPASIFDALATPDMVVNEVDPDELLPTGREEGEDGDGDVPAEAEAAAASEGAEMSGGDHDISAATTGGALAVRAAAVKPKELASLNDYTNHLKSLYGSNYFVAEMSKKFRRDGRSKRITELALWLPLSFPPIPVKGDFDVRKLKESKYFFS